MYQETHGGPGRINPGLFGNLIYDTVGTINQQEGMNYLISCSGTIGYPSEIEFLPYSIHENEFQVY